MSEPTVAQQLRASVKLIKPELLADVPDDYSPKQTFNYLRHKATNYEELLEQHKAKYGEITPAEQKALTQGAADVIIGAFRAENADLLLGKANTRFARFTRSLVQILKLEPDIDLQGIRDATARLKKSQKMYKSWNKRYQRQRDLVLKVAKTADPEIYRSVKEIYSANSDAKLVVLEKELFGG